MRKNNGFMKLMGLLLLFAVWLPGIANSAEPIKVQIVYLPHGPVMKVMQDLEQVFSQYPEAEITTFSFEESAGIELAESYGFVSHMPILLVINDSYKHQVNGQEVEFYNFPSNVNFAPTFKGGWGYQELSTLLKELSGR